MAPATASAVVMWGFFYVTITTLSPTIYAFGLPHQISLKKAKTTKIRTATKVFQTQESESASRRRVFLKNALFFTAVGIFPSKNVAIDNENDDLTSQLFNPDGSLKNTDVTTEASERVISVPVPDTPFQLVDGVFPDPISDSKSKTITYNLPSKWLSGYTDTSEGVNAPALNRVTVYCPPGKYSLDTLASAVRTGISKTLSLPGVKAADLISGKKVVKGGLTYYDFDLAVAPETCGKSDENLGLGFCPYDDIFLVRAVVTPENGGELVVFVLESNKVQWRRGNSDLKRVRESFRVS